MVTVLICTYRRAQDLSRCLKALAEQTRPADEILVVVRDVDSETRDLLALPEYDALPLRKVEVTEPGLVVARNAGLAAARGEIIAFTDDDSAPHPDWLARIEKHFRSDQEVGGVGGRDFIHHGDRIDDRAREVVGKVQWFGRIVTNHHLGVGKPREVDFLKGVNMSYRQAALSGIRFDERLRAAGGVQPDDDYLFSMVVKRAGWKLVYDPAVAVNHYQTKRFEGYRPREEDQGRFNAESVSARLHNRTLMLLEYFPVPQRLVFVLWAVCIGSRDDFGVVQWLRFLPSQRGLSGKKLRAALRGRLNGWKTWRYGRN